jgi:hypothetical protein
MSISSPDAAAALGTGAKIDSARSRFERLGRAGALDYGCGCLRCAAAAGPGADLPCWFMNVDATTVLVLHALRSAATRLDPQAKTLALKVFSHLVDNQVKEFNPSAAFRGHQSEESYFTQSCKAKESWFTLFLYETMRTRYFKILRFFSYHEVIQQQQTFLIARAL